MLMYYLNIFYFGSSRSPEVWRTVPPGLVDQTHPSTNWRPPQQPESFLKVQSENDTRTQWTDDLLTVILHAPNAHVFSHRNKECLNPARDQVTFPFNQLEDKQPILEFGLSQSETEQRYDGDGFRGFSLGECGREGEYRGKLFTLRRGTIRLS